MSEGQYQPPGWYHGEGDPPGTKRYWDGELWVGEPQAMPTAPPLPPSTPGSPAAIPQPHAHPHTSIYPEQSQATTVLVVGILSLVICGILGPVAWKMGNDEIGAIDAGRRDIANRGTAVAGKVLGIIATVFLAFIVLSGIAVVLVGLASV